MQKAQQVVPAGLGRQEPMAISNVPRGQAMARGHVQRAGRSIRGRAHQITRQSLKLGYQVLNTWPIEFHLSQAARASWHRVPLAAGG